AMAELAQLVDVPLATNLVVVEMEQVFEAITKKAVNIILGDHHYWCGATGAVRLNHVCQAANLGLLSPAM
ncbi:MAG: enolase C-terminal domain-like protein, partial [Thiolinea sp.]